MNRYTLFFFAMIFIALVSCKTSKTAKKQVEEPEPPAVSVVQEAPKKIEKTVEEPKPVAEPIAEAPIVIRSESFIVSEGEDRSKGDYDFHVIIGSFSNQVNAINYKGQLLDKGFMPVMLKSETGMFRIAVQQTNSEQEARGMIAEIRNKFPEHKDVWLLKKK